MTCTVSLYVPFFSFFFSVIVPLAASLIFFFACLASFFFVFIFESLQVSPCSYRPASREWRL